MNKTLLKTVTIVATSLYFTAGGALFSCEAKGWFSDSGKQISDDNKIHIIYTAKTKSDPKSWVTGRVLIKAPPEVVWRTVHEERHKDPDMAYSKVLERGVNEETYEEKFLLLPILGSATCVLKDKETPLKRIDYSLVKSDRFKAMEGSWVFTPCEDGKFTTVELISRVDLGLPVPQNLLDGNLAKKIERRLVHVRSIAESTSSKLASTTSVD
jgi:hypothetical protein